MHPQSKAAVPRLLPQCNLLDAISVLQATAMKSKPYKISCRVLIDCQDQHTFCPASLLPNLKHTVLQTAYCYLVSSFARTQDSSSSKSCNIGAALVFSMWSLPAIFHYTEQELQLAKTALHMVTADALAEDYRDFSISNTLIAIYIIQNYVSIHQLNWYLRTQSSNEIKW